MIIIIIIIILFVVPSAKQIKMKHHYSLSAVPFIDLQVTPYAIDRELTQFI